MSDMGDMYRTRWAKIETFHVKQNPQFPNMPLPYQYKRSDRGHKMGI